MFFLKSDTTALKARCFERKQRDKAPGVTAADIITSFPSASRCTLIAFFSSKAGSRLFTVKYLLLLMCRSWNK